MISVLAVELAFVTASSALDELPRYFYDLSGNLETRVAAKSAPLQIIGQPVSPVVAPGGIATFSVTLADASGVTFQWKFNGIDIAGATGDSLVLTTVSFAQEGIYSVVVTNSAGSVTITFALILGKGSDSDRLRATPASGMVAFWRGEADASDSIGSNHGTFYNGADPTTPSITQGLIGHALNFDGTVNVHVPYSAALEPAQITIEGWVYATTNGGNGTLQNIITRPRGPGVGPSWALGLSNGSLYFSTSQGSIGGVSHFPLYRWVHVAAVSDGATTFLYLNGVLDAQSGIGDGLLKYDQPGTVTLGTGFNGRVDEMSIYQRALTAGEVADIAGANSAGKDLTRPYFTTPSRFPLARVGRNYSQQVTTLFGTSPITFSVPAGGLPPGLVFSSAGLLSGTPSAAGNYSFTLRAIQPAVTGPATQATGNFTDQIFTLQVVSPLNPPAGLVAWWRAENNALDAAGTNDGTLSNGAGFAAGEVDQAFALNGTNQSVEIPDAPALRPASITLEAWVMFNTTDGNQAIFSKLLSGSYYVFFSSNLLFAGVGNSSSTPSIHTNFVPTVGRWYHIAFTFDDTSKLLSLYVDGVQIVSGTVNLTIGYDTNPISWGRYGSYYLNGRIDEAAIYNRALTAAELASICNSGPAGKQPPTPTPTPAQIRPQRERHRPF